MLKTWAVRLSDHLIEQRGSSRSYSPFPSVEIAADVQAQNRWAVGSLAFLVWDVTITLDEEARLIWAQPMSSMKFLYFVVRYASIMAQIPLLFRGSELSLYFHFTLEDCVWWQLFQIISTLIVVGALDVILIGRVRAMYHDNRIVKVLVYLLFLFEMGSIITGCALFIRRIEFSNTCVILYMPPQMAVYGLGSTIAMQAILFGLTFYKFVRHARVRAGRHTLVVHLMRDGAWAFFVLFFIDFLQVMLYAGSNSISRAFSTWRLTLGAVCGYRVFLNLRKFHENMTKRRAANIRELTPLARGDQVSLPAPAALSSV